MKDKMPSLLKILTLWDQNEIDNEKKIFVLSLNITKSYGIEKVDWDFILTFFIFFSISSNGIE